MTTDDSPAPRQRLRVAFVPGVTPDKWARIWAERMPRDPLELAPVPESDQTEVLYDGRADLSFVRLPVDDERLHVIPLYTEVAVVVVPKGHFVEAADEVTLDDLAEEITHPVPPLTVQEAVDTVAAGVGIVLLPMSLARLHHRKDVALRPVTDGPHSRVGLAWRRDLEDERVEVFIGVVRGRRAGSSRGPTGRTGATPAGERTASGAQASAGRKQPAGRTGKNREGRGRPGRAGRGRRR